MANSLLDFVMSLVRDPEAAARYAADPGQAIADAHLTDVTASDVQNLIPVVSESLSMTTPSFGADAFVDPGANVWASGAATAAFDAFDDRLPESAVIDVDDAVPDAIGEDISDFDAFTGTGVDDTAASLQFDVPLLEDAITTDAGLGGIWPQPVSDHDPGDHSPGFDAFD